MNKCLHYHELMRKIKEYKRKKCLMVDDYIRNKVLHKIKEIIEIENLIILKY